MCRITPSMSDPDPRLLGTVRNSTNLHLKLAILQNHACSGRTGLDATSVRVAELNGQPLQTVAATAPSMSDLPVLQGPHAPPAPAHAPAVAPAPAPVALPVLPSSPVVDQALPVIPVDDGRARMRAILMKVGASLITIVPNAAASKGRAQGPMQSVNAILCIEGFAHGAGPLPSGQPVHVLGEKAHVTVNAIPRGQCRNLFITAKHPNTMGYLAWQIY